MVVSARHDVTSPADASERALSVDAASVDAWERQRSSVFALVNVWKTDSESETAGAAAQRGGSAAAALRTDAAHGGQVQLEAHVAVAGVTLGNADALAVLTAVQNPTILGGTQAGVCLVAPWKNDKVFSQKLILMAFK